MLTFERRKEAVNVGLYCSKTTVIIVVKIVPLRKRLFWYYTNRGVMVLITGRIIVQKYSD